MRVEIRKLQKSEFPFLLRQISRLPDEMDIAGILPSDEYKFLCVIGSRNHSDYGRQACFQLIEGLQGYPVVIVSGLAIGIDSLAHEAAIKFGLKTIAFPGSGLSASVLYPPSGRNLAERIIQNGGAVISAFNMDQPGAHWTFPARNRLMAGMSHATLIIEAKEGSGTLLTADDAGEFSRDILTVPGSIFSDLSYGPHMLMRHGAITVTSSKDILEVLGFEATNANNQNLTLRLAHADLTESEKLIVNIIRYESLSASDIIEKTGLQSSAFNIAVSELELKDIISQSGGIYRIKL